LDNMFNKGSALYLHQGLVAAVACTLTPCKDYPYDIFVEACLGSVSIL